MATNTNPYYTTGFLLSPVSGVPLADNVVPRADSTLVGAVQSSTVTIGDTGNVAGIVDLAVTGAISGATSIAVSGALTGITNLTATGTVKGDIANFDTIADEAGSGAPAFSQGLTVAASKDVTFGASGVLKVDTIADRAGTGAPAFSQGLTVAASKNLTLGASGIVRAPTFTDVAGTGPPAFSMGLTVAASKDVVLAASGIVKTDTITDIAGTGAVNASMGLGIASAKTLTLTGYLKLVVANAGAVASASIAMPTGGSLVKLASETVNLDGILTAGLTTGMVVILQSPATGTVTLRDATAAASAAEFRLGAATRALVGNSTWTGYYDGATLQELAFAPNT